MSIDNSEIIMEKVKPRLYKENKNLEESVVGLKAKLNAEGMLNSGRFLEQLNALLLNHINSVSHIIWHETFSLVQTYVIKVEIAEIAQIVYKVSSNYIMFTEELLKKEVESKNSENVLKELDFSGKTKEILESNINVYELNLRGFIKEEYEKAEALKLAKNSKAISIWSIVVSTVIALVAIIISVIALYK